VPVLTSTAHIRIHPSFVGNPNELELGIRGVLLRLLGTDETKTKIKTISNPLSDKRERKTSNS